MAHYRRRRTNRQKGCGLCYPWKRRGNSKRERKREDLRNDLKGADTITITTSDVAEELNKWNLTGSEPTFYPGIK